jgi:PII-like signaling protein
MTSAKLLRIYLDEADRYGHKPLYEAIVLKARELGLAGATVFRSPMGYGQTTVLKTSKILNLSTDLPMVIDLVDSQEKLETLVPFLKEFLVGGLVILQDVTVVHQSAVSVG